MLAALSGRMPLADGERFVPGMWNSRRRGQSHAPGRCLFLCRSDAALGAGVELPDDSNARLQRIFATDALAEAAASLGIISTPAPTLPRPSFSIASSLGEGVGSLR